MRENIYLPSMMCLFVQKTSIQNMIFTRTFLFVNRFSKYLLHILRQPNAELCQENISATFKHFQNICEKAVSATRKHT